MRPWRDATSLDGGADRRHVARVEEHEACGGAAECAGQRSGLLRVAAGDDDGRALLDQRLRARFADAAVAARDQRDLALQRTSRRQTSSTLFLPNKPRLRNVTTAMNSRYIESSDHSDA